MPVDQKILRPSRRRFLAGVSTSALIVAAHGPGYWAEEPSKQGQRTAQRILRLRLWTATPLSKMREFYGKELGLPIANESASELTFDAGGTSITFVVAAPEHGNPFYHFAFNIPENKLLHARRWQRERTELLPVFPHLRDPSFPEDVVHFRHWNAHSIFFLDPAGNVVEYIARHDLKNAASGPFDAQDILYASEIAFVTDDVPALGQDLQRTFDLPRYRQASDTFHAVGDEHGLLLVFKRGRNLGLASERPRHADVFPIRASIRGAAGATYEAADYPFKIETARSRRS